MDSGSLLPYRTPALGRHGHCKRNGERRVVANPDRSWAGGEHEQLGPATNALVSWSRGRQRPHSPKFFPSSTIPRTKLRTTAPRVLDPGMRSRMYKGAARSHGRREVRMSHTREKGYRLPFGAWTAPAWLFVAACAAGTTPLDVQCFGALKE